MAGMNMNPRSILVRIFVVTTGALILSLILYLYASKGVAIAISIGAFISVIAGCLHYYFLKKGEIKKVYVVGAVLSLLLGISFVTIGFFREQSIMVILNYIIGMGLIGNGIGLLTKT